MRPFFTGHWSRLLWRRVEARRDLQALAVAHNADSDVGARWEPHEQAVNVVDAADRRSGDGDDRVPLPDSGAVGRTSSHDLHHVDAEGHDQPLLADDARV